MPKSRRYLIISLSILFAIGLAWAFLRSTTPVVPEAIKRGYSEALAAARNGQPGAARVLYQQLGRPDISPKRRVWLHAELPNYPSSVALKLADADLQHESPEVRIAAIKSISGLVPSGQRSLLLGPLLDDSDQSVQFAAVNALLGLSRMTSACISDRWNRPSMPGSKHSKARRKALKTSINWLVCICTMLNSRRRSRRLKTRCAWRRTTCQRW